MAVAPRDLISRYMRRQATGGPRAGRRLIVWTPCPPPPRNWRACPARCRKAAWWRAGLAVNAAAHPRLGVGVGRERRGRRAPHPPLRDPWPRLPFRPVASSLVLGEGNGEDGYLRVDEIFGLELDADLVVLSGCSTGLGRLTGDGIFGLTARSSTRARRRSWSATGTSAMTPRPGSWTVSTPSLRAALQRRTPLPRRSAPRASVFASGALGRVRFLR